ncbi:MAG: hypothetical protein KAJ01_10655, partial [Candidatus Hydrogenedentes bacterium]|nr:hypothetical protein [Candidatus Hydrogenedentota bacterium]
MSQKFTVFNDPKIRSGVWDEKSYVIAQDIGPKLGISTTFGVLKAVKRVPASMKKLLSHSKLGSSLKTTKSTGWKVPANGAWCLFKEGIDYLGATCNATTKEYLGIAIPKVNKPEPVQAPRPYSPNKELATEGQSELPFTMSIGKNVTGLQA